jgi:hypothetical protein
MFYVIINGPNQTELSSVIDGTFARPTLGRAWYLWYLYSALVIEVSLDAVQVNFKALYTMHT